MSHELIRRILEESRKVEEGREERGKRDGTGPYKDSAQRSISDVGRRKAAGEPCPAEDSELQTYATEPPGAMGEQSRRPEDAQPGDKVYLKFAKTMGEGAGTVISNDGTSLQVNVNGTPRKVFYSRVASVESGGGPASPDLECEVSAAEMESVCPECARNMREHNIVGIRLRYLLEAGVLEITDDDGDDVVLLEKKGEDGWPKKLKKGRFTSYCKSAGYDGPSIACAKKAMKSDDKSVRGMASFYMNTVKPKGRTASAVKADGRKKECGPVPDEE